MSKPAQSRFYETRGLLGRNFVYRFQRVTLRILDEDAASDDRDDNRGSRRHPPPPFRMHGCRLDKLRRVHNQNPALIAIRDVRDYGGAAGVVEAAFDESAEVFGWGMGSHGGTCG